MGEVSNPAVIKAYNIKGRTTEFSLIAWSRMKQLPDGSRIGGWRELKPGEDVAKLIGAANVPAALKASRGGAPVPLSAPTFSNEEKLAMMETEVSKRVGDELDKFHGAMKAQTLVLDKMAEYIMNNHSDAIKPEGDLADTVISVLQSNKTKLAETVAQQDEISNIRKYLDDNGVQLPEGQSFSDSLILLLQSKANPNPAPEQEKKAVKAAK